MSGDPKTAAEELDNGIDFFARIIKEGVRKVVTEELEKHFGADPAKKPAEPPAQQTKPAPALAVVK